MATAPKKKKSKIKVIAKKKVKKLPPKKLAKKVVTKKPKPKPKPKLKLKTKVKSKISKKSKIVSKRKSAHKGEPVKLEKHSNNPIIAPSFYPWESKATFNPSAFALDGKIHIVYRAIGHDDVSVLGYASSSDGLSIDERPTYCVYQRSSFTTAHSGPSIEYISGGGWSGGCEDPRITTLGDTLYMLYTAFDGWGSVRIALTSILVSDFKKKNWNWKPPVLISPPGEINKNWVLFPEKINGKFAIMHSFYPKVRIDYFDSLDELDGRKFIKSNNTRPIDYTRDWDSWFRGVGPSPIKTSEGWLVLYHAMDHNNPDRYRMGALLLDKNDPTKILHRSVSPILEPEETYENEGHKWGVIYSCGAVVKDGTLFVYYGGADKFVCVASLPVSELLDSLKKDKKVKLKNKTLIKTK